MGDVSLLLIEYSTTLNANKVLKAYKSSAEALLCFFHHLMTYFNYFYNKYVKKVVEVKNIL